MPTPNPTPAPPVIVRRGHDKGMWYTLIGDEYVHCPNPEFLESLARQFAASGEMVRLLKKAQVVLDGSVPGEFAPDLCNGETRSSRYDVGCVDDEIDALLSSLEANTTQGDSDG